MWPLVKKQLHQTKVMRQMQPEMKKIKQKSKGNRTLESQLMMELYKEKGVNPLSSIGLLIVQVPILIGLFSALNSLESPARLISLPYSFVQSTQSVEEITSNVVSKTNAAIETARQEDPQAVNSGISSIGLNPDEPLGEAQLRALSHEQLTRLYNEILVDKESKDARNKSLVHGPFFDQHLFGIDLSRRGIQAGHPVYIPLIIFAVLAGVVQYLQTKQLSGGRTDSKERKTIRQILRESSEGKEPDQSEINAAVGSRMSLFFAPMIAYISAISLGGLAVYFLTSGIVGYIQQRSILEHDVEEMEEIADEPEPKVETSKSKKKKKKNTSPKRNKKKG